MTTRALNRSGQPAAPLIELPVLSRPQVVNQDGFELDEEEIAALEDTLRAENGTSDVLDDRGTVGTEAELDGEVIIQPGEGEEDREPVLSLADSLVLPYSLTLTRQHHLTHLLPHIFSHPIVPAHSRPRARGPPKSTFLFPNPPPPTLPLPSKEYHGPLKPVDTNASREGSAPATPDGQATTPSPNKPKKSFNTTGESPAHEIECIARVTLTIGPISYPGTELWVGRFMERRAAPPRREKDMKRQSLAEASAARRARIGSTPIASPTPSTAVQRVPFGPQPPPRPSAPPAALPPRTNLPPNLIQRVNAVATQHPWLSVIIHKAARSSATKDELAKLGRVVARLGRGEGVGEGPDEGTVTLSTPSAPQVAALASTSAAVSGAEVEDSSDSDSDVDTTGPKQVGGGPIHPDLQAAPFTANPPANLPTPMRRPPANATPKPSPRLPVPLGMAAPSQPSSSGPSTSRPPGPYAQSSLSTPAPPPRPTYPLPPPLLLVAFKEAPTEKYLLPLGSQSYISRVGGDYVTGPPPMEARPAPPPPAPAPAVGSVGPALIPVPEPTISSPAGRGRGRTRASLGRPKPPTPVPAEPEPESEMIVEVVKVAPVGPVLPPVPGTKPADGAVLLSTFLPTDGWLRPDWEELETHLPFGKADGIKLKQESPLPSTPSVPNVPVGPSIAPRPRATPKLLNLGAKSFLPLEGDLHAVTIRLSDINDRVWRRVKWIMEEVERAEMAADGETEPKLPAADSTPTIGNSADFAQPALSASASTDPSRPPSAKVIPLPRSTYLHKKRSRFQSLLRRVPPRPFLRYRLPQPIPSLIEATSDKWAPRPYPISTKPLYTTDDADLQLHLPLPPTPSSPGTSKKRRRKEDEPEVTFEMPVSLDALDERVAEGAMRSLGARGRGRGRGRGGGGGKVDDGRRRYGKRAVPGRVCEGCGGEGLKIWRRGPGGKGTLCNPCGDQYLAGTLGDLKAPGAGSLNVDVEEKPEQSDQEALEIGEGSEPQLEPDRRGGAVKEKAEVHAMAERPPQTNVENIREIPATIITPTSTVAATQTVIEVLNPKSVIPTQTDGVGKESEASPAVELGDGMAPGQQSTPAKQAEAEKMNVDG